MQITGLVEKFFYKEKSGICEFQIIDSGDHSRKRVRGYMQDVHAGMAVLLHDPVETEEGFYTYREAEIMVSDEQEAVSILSCADGISESLSRKIVEELGTQVYRYLDIPGIERKLLKIPGIGSSKASAMVRFLETKVSSNEDFLWLVSKGFPSTSAMQLIKEHGRGTKEFILADPYQPVYKMRMDFEPCDRIAVEAGENPWSERRVRAALWTVLKDNENRGNTRIENKKLAGQCRKRAAWNHTQPVPEELFLLQAYSEGFCTVECDGDAEWVYTKRMRYAETGIVRDIRRIQSAAMCLPAPGEEGIRAIEAETGISYNEEQKETFRMFENGGILILTGDPGTGKTTTINGLIKYYERCRPDSKVLLCAPTGRAASRLSEVSGKPGMTMHRAMKLTPYETELKATETLKEDLLIVDEMSMCDTELFAYFLSSVKSGATLILTGDPNQLPSVGPGNVFRDLIESGRFPVFRLTRLVRQKEESGIIRNARAVLNGEGLTQTGDFRIICPDREEDLADLAVREAAAMKDTPLILSPLKKSPSGTLAINRKMQDVFRRSSECVWINGIRFYIGDPVIMGHNNYRTGYMNGDMGVMTGSLNGTVTVSLNGRFLTLDLSDAGDILPAYALSVHKAQGSEADDCIIVLQESSCHMASGELLNTAFTRAKKSVTLIATRRTIDQYLYHRRPIARECGLKSRLAGNA